MRQSVCMRCMCDKEIAGCKCEQCCCEKPTCKATCDRRGSDGEQREVLAWIRPETCGEKSFKGGRQGGSMDFFHDSLLNYVP